MRLPGPLGSISAALCVVLLSGCPGTATRPPEARTWELTDSGIVVSVEEVDGGGLRVALARGESIELPPDTWGARGGIIHPDDLLLLGTSPGGALGYVSLGIVADTCWILNEPAVDDGTHILFEFGFRLPKSSNFDPGSVDDGNFSSAYEGFCINGAGEVIRYGV